VILAINVSVPNLIIALHCAVSAVAIPSFPKFRRRSHDSDHTPLEATYCHQLTLWRYLVTYRGNVPNVKCLPSPIPEIGAVPKIKKGTRDPGHGLFGYFLSLLNWLLSRSICIPQFRVFSLFPKVWGGGSQAQTVIAPIITPPPDLARRSPSLVVRPDQIRQ